tara:strand:+ start:36295 stop:36525 length:231 start_codon:yes stop_codon:yes gene_type:complete
VITPHKPSRTARLARAALVALGCSALLVAYLGLAYIVGRVSETPPGQRMSDIDGSYFRRVHLDAWEREQAAAAEDE